MKKLFVESDYKIYNKKRSQNRNERRLSYKDWRINKNRSLLGENRTEIKKRNIFKQENPDFTKVIAPEMFSFINNTDEVVKFIDSLKCLYDKKKKVFVVLENVVEIDHSAIIVLLSIMVKFKAKNIKFNGNMPQNLEANKIVRESGFLNNLYKNFEEKESYEIPSTPSNGIHTHASKKVNSLLTGKIISSAAK